MYTTFQMDIYVLYTIVNDGFILLYIYNFIILHFKYKYEYYTLFLQKYKLKKKDFVMLS